MVKLSSSLPDHTALFPIRFQAAFWVGMSLVCHKTCKVDLPWPMKWVTTGSGIQQAASEYFPKRNYLWLCLEINQNSLNGVKGRMERGEFSRSVSVNNFR